LPKDINASIFSEGTKLKLEIFAECFREWFPVFVHHTFIRKIYIFDFFAGSGMDTQGNLGSPLILLSEARGKHCDAIRKNGKEILFAFNEKDLTKKTELKENVTSFIGSCQTVKCPDNHCVYKIIFGQNEFKDIFNDDSVEAILKNQKLAKFILLDQYGFSQVDEDIFLKLVDSPTTDFIFFISSSFIRRFKEHPVTKKYFDTNQIPFDEAKPHDCHRQIADYFESLISDGKEYYLHNFTIKKDANYWGLIFGTSHTLGMEKFLKVCWEKDTLAGESNFNIDNDFPAGSLFYESGKSNKLDRVKKELRGKILSREIIDNKRGLQFTLKRRCLPKLFVNVIDELIKERLIVCKPKFSREAVNIHRLKNEYLIEVLQK
jgi:three-Cys-motif partner protein